MSTVTAFYDDTFGPNVGHDLMEHGTGRCCWSAWPSGFVLFRICLFANLLVNCVFLLSFEISSYPFKL